MPYKSKNSAGPFIIQHVHNDCWIDWLEVRKPSSDPSGYGLFAFAGYWRNEIHFLILGKSIQQLGSA